MGSPTIPPPRPARSEERRRKRGPCQIKIAPVRCLGACGDECPDVKHVSEEAPSHLTEEPGGGETRCNSGYVHTLGVRLQAIANYIKFKEVEDASIEQVACSSLGVIGWAFATVPDWKASDPEVAPTNVIDGHGSCVNFKLNEPNTQKNDQDTIAAMRRSRGRALARQMLNPDLVKLFEELGIYDSVLQKIEHEVLITTLDDDGEILVGDDAWVDCDVDITLDSGCVDHIIDLGDAPGYGAFLTESAGSKRKRGYLVGTERESQTKVRSA